MIKKESLCKCVSVYVWYLWKAVYFLLYMLVYCVSGKKEARFENILA